MPPAQVRPAPRPTPVSSQPVTSTPVASEPVTSKPVASDRTAARILAHVSADLDAAVWHRDGETVVGVDAVETVVGNGAAALHRLDDLAPGVWVGWCAFELGHALEPVPSTGASREPAAVHDVVFARYAAHATVHADATVSISGDGPGRVALAHAVDAAARDTHAERSPSAEHAPAGSSEGWTSSLDRAAYEAAVRAIHELLVAGDCYQVNLTRRLTLPRALDPVRLFDALAAENPAPYAGFVRTTVDGRRVAVVGASPERYLSWRGCEVETRPIKGTARDRATLVASAKDHAENVMIVDLARNDLGRVCEPGSIAVPSLCAPEAHPGLHHLVSTVVGRLRGDVGPAALLAATFPPASVTGAPKPRVLAAIEELEPVRRGVYCGAFGWIDTAAQEGDLSVAIRTFTVHDDRTELGVGAGIVADSTPRAEWDESELKAARLLAATRTNATSAGSTSAGVRA